MERRKQLVATTGKVFAYLSRSRRRAFCHGLPLVATPSAPRRLHP
jgi:hypothetical protein